jgi:hypothetical protein
MYMISKKLKFANVYIEKVKLTMVRLDNLLVNTDMKDFTDWVIDVQGAGF